MKYQIIDATVRSVTVERINDDNYESTPCTVYLNGCAVRESEKNVITVFGLEPDTEYRIALAEKGEEPDPGLSFRTKKETILLNVCKFGACADGTHDDTAAIQAAIACCPKGGTVWFPKGTYLSGPLFAGSDMTLWIDKDAVILGQADRSHYPILPGMVRDIYDNDHEISYASWEGNPLDCFAALMTAVNADNLTIMGEGTIDGNAPAGDWWVNPKVRKIAWRPRLMFLNSCRNVTVQGITVRNSPSWTIHPYYSSDLRFLDITVQNPYDSPNTDGFDPESCRNVLLLGARISVGDDCIAIKSGKLYMARAHYQPSENFEIRNCSLEKGHGSVTMGSENAGGIRNVHVTHCRFLGTDRGVRIKTRRGRGERSVLTDLVFEHISMKDVFMPITVNMHYSCDPDGHSEYVQSQLPAPKDYRTPTVGTITLKDVKCAGVSVSLVCVCGLPESPVEKIILENVSAEYVPAEERSPYVPLMMDGFEPVSGESIWLKNVKELEVRNMHLYGSDIKDPKFGSDVRAEFSDVYIDGKQTA